ncbi:MAG: FAD:protein FMN transferase [Pseudooceanicola atlanticus]
MTLTRRRFLTITAASLAAGPAQAARSTWQGRALGADVSITIHGPREVAEPALQAARTAIARVEAEFSLFDPTSALSRLNRSGRIARPDPMMLELLQAADGVHRMTGGLFDPTIQTLWRALADGSDTGAARKAIGWDRVRVARDAVELEKGQSLTLNGIAQGYATDLVADLLRGAGLDRTLVNIGEYRGQGGPWRLSLEDPTFGPLGLRVLQDGAIATSSPMAMTLGGAGHILHAHAKSLWSTVSVEAASATLADGLSTALTLAPMDMIRAFPGRHGIHRITLVDLNGDLSTLTA